MKIHEDWLGWAHRHTEPEVAALLAAQAEAVGYARLITEARLPRPGLFVDLAHAIARVDQILEESP
jgi:hypothetical protein